MEADLRLEGGEAEIFKPFNFRMEEIEGFRYRAKDAMRKVTSIAVKVSDSCHSDDGTKFSSLLFLTLTLFLSVYTSLLPQQEARLKEIKSELLASSKLKAYFEDNPRDLQLLRHDKTLAPKSEAHLKNVPDYLVPDTLKGLQHEKRDSKRGGGRGGGAGGRGGGAGGRGGGTRPGYSGGGGGAAGKGDAFKKFKRKQNDPLKSFQFNSKKRRT